MKGMYIFMIVAITLAFSSQAFATTPDYTSLTPESSWETIENTPNTVVRYPSIPAVGIHITYDELCVDGNTFKANKTYEECVKWEQTKSSENDPVCVESVNRRIQTTRTHTGTECNPLNPIGKGWDTGEWTCLRVSGDKHSWPLDVKASVYSVNPEGDYRSLELLFTKPYTVPQCES